MQWKQDRSYPEGEHWLFFPENFKRIFRKCDWGIQVSEIHPTSMWVLKRELLNLSLWEDGPSFLFLPKQWCGKDVLPIPPKPPHEWDIPGTSPHQPDNNITQKTRSQYSRPSVHHDGHVGILIEDFDRGKLRVVRNAVCLGHPCVQSS